MKRFFIVILALVMAIVAFNAVIGTAAAPIIGVASQHVTNDWNKGVVKGITTALEKLGYQMNHTNAQGNTNQQVADVENFITRKVSGVIIAGGEGPAFGPALKKLKAAKIPVVTVDIPSSDTLCNITSDNFNGGEKLSLYLVNKLGGKGKIVVFDTPGWASLAIRYRMLEAVLKDYPEIKIASRFEAGVTDAVNSTYQQMKSFLLSNPDVNAVYCTWGLPAIGASKAIKELKLQDKIFVTCVDADQVVLQEMNSSGSPLTGVIGQYPELLGSMSVDMLKVAMQGKATPLEAYAPIILIEKNNPTMWFSGTKILTPSAAWKALYPGVALTK